eukprot:CAMPEP_0117526380 /NCGR_PEP_ID=MMETSP0784-20121206/36255_1 /TAXON_ID=39447 /ORGANISM="" /LENGTH=168 /DNA_ID=CAMNT_0005322605 /DNA_START=380 /DNA_END=886 /DNA_ORIENTATION=-
MRPLADVSPTVGKVITAFSMHFVVLHLSFEQDVLVGPAVEAETMLPAIDELAAVLRTIGVALDAGASLLVLDPLALIRAAIDMDVFTFPMRFVLFPLSLVHVASGDENLSMTMCLAVTELSLVHRAIVPRQNANALEDAPFPLPFVPAALHLDLGLLHHSGVIDDFVM